MHCLGAFHNRIRPPIAGSIITKQCNYILQRRRAFLIPGVNWGLCHTSYLQLIYFVIPDDLLSNFVDSFTFNQGKT